MDVMGDTNDTDSESDHSSLEFELQPDSNNIVIVAVDDGEPIENSNFAETRTRMIEMSADFPPEGAMLAGRVIDTDRNFLEDVTLSLEPLHADDK